MPLMKAIPHLALRMSEHARRARFFAENLEKIGLGVTYPGLESHPDHALMKHLHCTEYGYGGILTLDLGSAEKADTLMDVLQNNYHFGFMAVSLGYFDTLMCCPGSSVSSEMTEDDLSLAGIENGLLRISVGFTGTMEQRWTQLEGALWDIGMVSAEVLHSENSF